MHLTQRIRGALIAVLVIAFLAGWAGTALAVDPVFSTYLGGAIRGYDPVAYHTVYLCSSPPYLLQTRNDRRMHEYTQLAFDGQADKARQVRDSLNPVREALSSTRPGGKPHAHQKYWQELLCQVGGSTCPPFLQLTEEEKERTREAFEGCGLRV